MLEKHLFLPFQEIFVLSHPGNKDCCYGKHTMELALWTQTQLILWQLCVFTRKIAIFKETIQTDREREGKACKARSLEFQSTRETLRVINKMAEKKQLHCWRGMSVCSHHDMTREKLRRALYLCCAVNVLCTNRVPVVYSKVWKYLYSDTNYIILALNANITSTTEESQLFFVQSHPFSRSPM